MTTPIVEINLKNAVVLQRRGIITSAGDEYGITYFLSLGMDENYALLREILNGIWKTLKGSGNRLWVEWGNE